MSAWPSIPARGTDPIDKPRMYQPTDERTLCLDSRGFRNVPIKPKYSDPIMPRAELGFISRLRKGPQ